jgi:hypothetical protein
LVHISSSFSSVQLAYCQFWPFFFGMTLLVSIVRGTAVHFGENTSYHVSELLQLWPVGLLLAFAQAVSIVVSGVLLGLFSYPFYAWLCRRRGGVILRGKFEVML